MIRIILIIAWLLTFGNSAESQYQNTPITTNPYDQSEAALSVSPLSNRNILLAWDDYRINDGYNKGQCGGGWTTDGGLSWQQGIITVDTTVKYGANPSVAYDRNGNMFVCFLARDRDDNRGIYVVRSSSPSSLPSSPKRVSTSALKHDKPWMVVDNTGGPSDGRIYVTWTEHTPGSFPAYYIFSAYSDDHGQSFSTPFQLDSKTSDASAPFEFMPTLDPPSGTLIEKSLQWSYPAVAPNGDVYVCWVDIGRANEPVPVTIKTKKGELQGDGTISWSGAATTNLHPKFLLSRLGGTAVVFTSPSFAVDASGNLCIAYVDWKSETEPEPRVKFAKSTDDGTNWSTQIVGEVGTGWQFFPSLSLDVVGRVCVGFFHSGNPTGESPETDMWVATSYDGGTSFMKNERITYDHSYPINATYTFDYCQIAAIAVNEKVLSAWTDIRGTNDNTDVYFTSLVTISEEAGSAWNLLSVPALVNNSSSSAIWPNANGGPFRWDGSSYQFEGLTDNEPFGWWLRFNAPTENEYRGVEILSTTISLSSGWNMIGSLSEQLPTSKLVTTPGGIIVNNRVYGFNGVYSTVASIDPGRGYWVYCSNAGSVTLDIFSTANNPPSGSPGDPPPSPSTPEAPVLASPGNGTTGQPTNIILCWDAVEDAIGYHLQVSTSQSFSSFTVNDSLVTAISRQVSSLSTSTTYYWRVRAQNDFCFGSWSAIRHFTTDTVTEPVLSGTGYLYQGSYRPSLSWTATGNTYKLYRYICYNDDEECLNSGGPGTKVYEGSATSHIDYGVIIGDKFSNATVFYYVRALDAQGHTSAKSNLKTYYENLQEKIAARPAEESFTSPSETKLGVNYPNPFNPLTKIDFQLVDPGQVSLIIYNVLGQDVAILAKKSFESGHHSVTWSAGNAPSGIYYARMIVRDASGKEIYQAMRKVLLMK